MKICDFPIITIWLSLDFFHLKPNSMLQSPPYFLGSLFYSSELEMMLLMLDVDIQWHEINIAMICKFIKFVCCYFYFLSWSLFCGLLNGLPYVILDFPSFRILCTVMQEMPAVSAAVCSLNLQEVSQSASHFMNLYTLQIILWSGYVSFYSIHCI